jgi:hypothetical protein
LESAKDQYRFQCAKRTCGGLIEESGRALLKLWIVKVPRRRDSFHVGSDFISTKQRSSVYPPEAQEGTNRCWQAHSETRNGSLPTKHQSRGCQWEECQSPRDLVIMYPSDICALARFPSWKRSCCPIADVRLHVCCGTLRVAAQQNGTEYRSTASRSGGEAAK